MSTGPVQNKTYEFPTGTFSTKVGSAEYFFAAPRVIWSPKNGGWVHFNVGILIDGAMVLLKNVRVSNGLVRPYAAKSGKFYENCWLFNQTGAMNLIAAIYQWPSLRKYPELLPAQARNPIASLSFGENFYEHLENRRGEIVRRPRAGRKKPAEVEESAADDQNA